MGVVDAPAQPACRPSACPGISGRLGRCISRHREDRLDREPMLARMNITGRQTTMLRSFTSRQVLYRQVLCRQVLCRQVLALAAAALALVALPQAASAQKYPERPVRLVLPLGAAGVGDITARIIAERLGDKLGQRFVIENMPGPGGIVAGRAVLSAPADGYTLLLMTGGIASSVPLYNKFPLDMTKDFVAISSMGYFDCLMVVNAQSEFKTLSDFLKVARDKPGKLNIGTISAGGVQNLTANYFKQAS